MFDRERERLPRHIFLSYSRADGAFAEALLASTREAGLQTWIDAEGIEPGTPDWQRSIRAAVQDAYAVVLVCSPNTIESQCVAAELQIAKRLNRQIFPVWASGDYWVDCVPLDFVNYQYIDCRSQPPDEGFAQLVSKLYRVVAQGVPKLFKTDDLNECPPGFTRILLFEAKGEDSHLLGRGSFFAREIDEWGSTYPDYEIIVANTAVYHSMEDLTDDLYARYLQDRYAPYTYGRDWVLARSPDYATLLAVPWEWLRYRRQRLLIDVVDGYTERSTPLRAYGIGAKPHGQRRGKITTWTVVDEGFDRAYGVVTSREDLWLDIADKDAKLLYATMGNSGDGSRVKIRGFNEVDPANYKYKFVVADPGCRYEEVPEGSVCIID